MSAIKHDSQDVRQHSDRSGRVVFQNENEPDQWIAMGVESLLDIEA